MDTYIGSKLIIVEGLTGSGKSIMAHFIARQLQAHGIPASWVHEGEEPHPILLDVDTTIEAYMDDIRANWQTYISQIGSDGKVRVIEASFFNNLIETLMCQNLERPQIIAYGKELMALIAPLNPTLVYLMQPDLEAALERNFANRGEGFKNFVIEFATSEPIAKARGWEGYDGMLAFWREFVSLTDELYQRFPGNKIRIDNTAGEWDEYDRQVIACLGLERLPEPELPINEAQALTGRYEDAKTGRQFAVQMEDGRLTVNLFGPVRTRLVWRAGTNFYAEGWPFEITFEPGLMRIAGRDVDYLALVGTAAERVEG